MKNIEKGIPEYGKQYMLTGATGAKCIMNGNTWKESEVPKEVLKKKTVIYTAIAWEDR